MVKMTRLACVSAQIGVAFAACLVSITSPAGAFERSDAPAAILTWPKIVVDSSTDTLLNLSNTDHNKPKLAHCFYIDANKHCSNDDTTVCSNALTDCTGGATCVQGWNEMDFDIVVTPEQPINWSASKGLPGSNFPIAQTGSCSGPPGFTGLPCSTDMDCGLGAGQCLNASNNLGSSIPPVPESTFIGALTCIEFDDTANPPTLDMTNELIGSAKIEVSYVDPVRVDVQEYNAVGLQTSGTCSNDPSMPCSEDFECGTGTCIIQKQAPGTTALAIGGNLCNQTFAVCKADSDCPNNITTGETCSVPQAYRPCAPKLVLNHIFDGAVDPIDGGSVRTDLTLVPCGNNFLRQVPGSVTAQFLVFNEFEQRFSTSRLVDCFLESQLSNIDTPVSRRSIFNFNVAGTLVGQTWIRGVGIAPTGNGLHGVARVFVTTETRTSGAAYNLDQIKGLAATPDAIVLPSAIP